MEAERETGCTLPRQHLQLKQFFFFLEEQYGAPPCLLDLDPLHRRLM
jgi:hypothetical protein